MKFVEPCQFADPDAAVRKLRQFTPLQRGSHAEDIETAFIPGRGYIRPRAFNLRANQVGYRRNPNGNGPRSILTCVVMRSDAEPDQPYRPIEATRRLNTSE